MNNQNSSSSSISSSLNQLKTNNLPKLKLNKTIKTSILSNQIVEYIVNEIKLIPHYDTMSNDLHLMNHIANMIENLERSDLEPKLDKKQLFLDIVKQLFPNLNTDQLAFIDNFVDFICSNNLVNKVSNVSKIVSKFKKNLS